MKEKTTLKLPDSMVKEIEYGKEEENVYFIVVTIGAFYLLGLVSYFCAFKPFGKDYLVIELICAFVIAIILFILCYWLISQGKILASLRKTAIISYKSAKTDQEIHDAHLKLNELHVPISVVKQN